MWYVRSRKNSSKRYFSLYRLYWTNSSKKCNFKNIWHKINLSYHLLARVLAFLRVTYANEYSTCTRRKASLLVCGARVVSVCVCVCARLRLRKLLATITTTKEWHGKIITVCLDLSAVCLWVDLLNNNKNAAQTIELSLTRNKHPAASLWVITSVSVSGDGFSVVTLKLVNTTILYESSTEKGIRLSGLILTNT